MDIVRDVRNGLRIDQVMPIGKVLHTDIPTPIVPVVDELLRQHRNVLPRDPGYAAIDRPASHRTMTDGTIPKQLRPTVKVRLASQGLLQFLARGDGCEGHGRQKQR